ncbi:glycosyltransferase [Stygiolobus caldivivus]|uniref:Glycosyl transferase n=1 Tax=Stygiolobus caldivivus TaxID=2824673 RepID=A0A8D5U4D9_9CREN|nr:glycosyltransferase [Stygiolobus caldivivus]BCU69042.1 glycosyl transferase [Stygiolobus caldivivus]
MLLEYLGLGLLAFHFAEPAYYYSYIKKHCCNLPQGDEDIHPSISVIIPTYNERDNIRRKLRNVLDNYSLDKLEIIIVDSSTDGTYEEIQKEIATLNLKNVRLIREDKRRGKIYAVREGIKSASNNIVIITDADAFWEGSVIDAVKILRGNVGAVSCIKKATTQLENNYRDFYNIIRLGESSIYSTPIFHGEFTAFRKDVLKPEEIPNAGADDSTIATLVSLKGYRAICSDKVIATEIVPKGFDYFSWKIRRGSHLIRHFIRFLGKVIKSNNAKFRKIFLEETFLHLINPWLLILGLVFIGLSNLVLFAVLIALALVGLFLPPINKLLRAWLSNQFFLILSQLYAMRGEVLAWKKQKKY